MELIDNTLSELLTLDGVETKILSNYSYNQYKTLIIELTKIKYNINNNSNLIIYTILNSNKKLYGFLSDFHISDNLLKIINELGEIMKLIGRLNLSEAKNEYADYDDYIMMCKGRNTNLTRLFYNVLLEDVHFSVGYANSKEKIIDVKGFLFKDKTNPEYYMFHVKQFNGEL